MLLQVPPDSLSCGVERLIALPRVLLIQTQSVYHLATNYLFFCHSELHHASFNCQSINESRPLRVICMLTWCYGSPGAKQMQMMNDWWRMSEYLQLEYYAWGNVSANISKNIWQGPCSLLWSSLSLLEGFVHYFLEVQTLTAVSLCLIVGNDATLKRWGRLFRLHCSLPPPVVTLIIQK